MESDNIGLVISSITLGPNPKDGLRWNKGQEYRLLVEIDSVKEFTQVKISNIIFDREYFEKHGQRRYLVYVTKNGKTEHLHRDYINIPASVTYEI